MKQTRISRSISCFLSRVSHMHCDIFGTQPGNLGEVVMAKNFGFWMNKIGVSVAELHSMHSWRFLKGGGRNFCATLYDN